MRNIVLLASLAINLFLIGLFTGGQLFGGKPPQEPLPSATASLADDPRMIISRHNIRNLPPEYRKQARALIRTRLPDIRQYDRDVRAARQELNRLFGQAEYDKLAVADAMEKLRTVQLAQQELISQTMLDFIAQLPAEERIAMVARAEERQAERHRRYQKMREERKRDRKERRAPRSEEVDE